MHVKIRVVTALTLVIVVIVILVVVATGAFVCLFAQQQSLAPLHFLKIARAVHRTQRTQISRTRALARAAVLAANTAAETDSPPRMTPLLLPPPPPTPMTPFPVDAVFTWVNANDEAWQRARASAAASVFHEHFRDPSASAAASHARDELFYSVHLAEKYMPWLRHIFIVTQRPQVPWWLNGAHHPRVVVVHHDEFFDPTVIQPTFNSNVIESQLANLPMLAEHFVTFNDDTFVGQPLPRDAFFTDEGTPVVRFHEKSPLLRHKPTNSLVWRLHLANANAVCRELGAPFLLPMHVALPLRKSVLQRVTRVLKPLTAHWQPLRTGADFPIVYVAACAAPRVAPHPSVRTEYYRTTHAFRKTVMRTRSLPHMFCINVSFDAAVFERLLAYIVELQEHAAK
jgi:hypothetical protein